VHDITERKQAEEVLAESEELYRNLFENASIGMCHSTLEGKYLRINKALATMLGYESPEEVMSTITDIATQIHASSGSRADALEAMKKQAWIYDELPYLRKDGSIMIGKIAARKVDKRDGSSYLEAIIEDITERKQAEEALQERVKELKCLYSIADIIEKTDTIEEIYRQTAALMQNGFYYPELACARITYEDQEFQTRNFQETEWKISADMIVHGKRLGVVEAYCLKEMPERDEGPFHKEERDLINAVAQRLGKATELKQYKKDLERLIAEALSEIKTLSGLLPICASCKKIRNDEGYWEQIESYIGQHSEAEFSHGICPDCARKLYPEFYQEK